MIIYVWFRFSNVLSEFLTPLTKGCYHTSLGKKANVFYNLSLFLDVDFFNGSVRFLSTNF